MSVKQKWVKALCSSQYKQGKGFLESSGRLCCLGVATKVGLAKDVRGENHLVTSAFLPLTAQRDLAALNDAGVPFEMIAGFIDVYWDKMKKAKALDC